VEQAGGNSSFLKLLCGRVVNIFGYPLRAGILAENRKVIQTGMIQGRADIAEYPLDDSEIDKHAPIVKLFAPDPKTDAVVVAVEILALAVIVAQKMGRREIGFHPDAVHVPSIPFAAQGIKRRAYGD
jgi:hypothetical protein